MSVVLAVDPGSERSASVMLERDDGSVVAHGIQPNGELLAHLRDGPLEYREFVVEWMQPRGMPTSAQEFETLMWIGRFIEAVEYRSLQRLGGPGQAHRLSRLKVKTHLCGSAKANDTNIRAALIDRFGGTGGKAAAVGLKKSPGPLYGIAADEWAALALAVTWADLHT